MNTNQCIQTTTKQHHQAHTPCVCETRESHFQTRRRILLQLRLVTGEAIVSRPAQVAPWLQECAQAILSYGGGYLPHPMESYEVECHPGDSESGIAVMEIRNQQELAALLGVCWRPSAGIELWESLWRASQEVLKGLSIVPVACHQAHYPNLSGWFAVVHHPSLLTPTSASNLAELAKVERALAHAAIP